MSKMANDLRKCAIPECSNPARLSSTGRTGKYCSDACKQKSYRERKAFRNAVALPSKPRLDLIVCTGGNREFLRIACEAGYMLGLRSGYASYGYDIAFVDSEYQRPNFERHKRETMKYRPK